MLRNVDLRGCRVLSFVYWGQQIGPRGAFRETISNSIPN